jgi:hypothetical protein
LTVADPDDTADFVLDENLISKLELQQWLWSWACPHECRLPMTKHGPALHKEPFKYEMNAGKTN